jgi:hypothetical protein
VSLLPWLRAFASSFHSIATSPNSNLAPLHPANLWFPLSSALVPRPLIDEFYRPNENNILVSRGIMTKSFVMWILRRFYCANPIIPIDPVSAKEYPNKKPRAHRPGPYSKLWIYALPGAPRTIDRCRGAFLGSISR